MRLNRVQEKVKKKKLDGFLITNLKNIYYLSSCSGS
ncbi:aminopeptidase P family protein, partial [Candidatus Peregrinibacteria bacterium]|nr:aminopeptidase P family protein [Candidatus Peregrinibacteria bacterium]